jgi:hypothetical protein
MALHWESCFTNFGIKTVGNNDRIKNAYLPNKAQQHALGAAGITPGTERDGNTFELTVLCDPARASVVTSYYASLRSSAAGRPPEIRMGRDLITRWLVPGDQLLIGNIGPQLFALKLAGAPATGEAMAAELGRGATLDTLAVLAGTASGPPPTRTVARTEHLRNPYVVFGALARAGGGCELPGCARSLFLKDDGVPYLEVHHIHPLSEGGYDTLENAAAVCPGCHRELHHGVNRASRRLQLRDAVAAKGPA